MLHLVFQEKNIVITTLKYSFFITPTDSIEGFNVILSLNLDKSDGTKSIATRIFKLLNK